MLRGLYTGWTGMVNEQKRLDVISNNLANADTLGYKQESVSSQRGNGNKIHQRWKFSVDQGRISCGFTG